MSEVAWRSVIKHVVNSLQCSPYYVNTSGRAKSSCWDGIYDLWLIAAQGDGI